MNIQEYHKKADFLRDTLVSMQEIADLPDDILVIDAEAGAVYPDNLGMNDIDPGRHEMMQEKWEELKRNIPPGFDIDGNLIRHLTFNQVNDWADIRDKDIPRELRRVEDYRKKLNYIEYLNGLSPEISRVAITVLLGDIDSALKTLYASIDAYFRETLRAIGPSESTPALIGRAFREGKLKAPIPEQNDAARNFLSGAFSYYRSIIIHYNLPPHRNTVEASLSLFALAHEVLTIFKICLQDSPAGISDNQPPHTISYKIS